MNVTRQVAMLLGMTVLLLASWLKPMDAPAMQQVDAGLKRALVSFATARALNGAISVIQGTQIGIQPLGIGVTLSLGQVLAPFNELLKNFSDLMLMASVAFGIQKVLISISSYLVILLALTATAIVWAALYVRQHPPPAWLSKLLVILLMLRFAIPVVVLGSDTLSQKFLASDYAASQEVIDTASGQAASVKVAESPMSESSGMLEKFKVPKIPDFKEMMRAVEQATEHMIKLMVIFLLQTLVIPLLLLWGLYGVVRGVFEPPRLSALRLPM